ncbi:MAG: hypothetical protein HOP09_18215 [Hyphomicrobium sp.]|nr:hypothetical protein [Hyphomicrobium sp.]
MALNKPPVAATSYLNVDLELRSASGLNALIDALAPVAFVLHHEPQQWASLELRVETDTPEQSIQNFCSAIESFHTDSRKLWDQCEKRCFDIGVQSGLTPYSKRFLFSAETISRLSVLNAEVVLTVYAAETVASTTG